MSSTRRQATDAPMNTVSQMLLALIYPMVLGLNRIETVSFRRSNGSFLYLTGLPGFPDPQTLRRFLRKAPGPFPGTVAPRQRSTAAEIQPLARAPLASRLRPGQHGGDRVRKAARCR